MNKKYKLEKQKEHIKSFFNLPENSKIALFRNIDKYKLSFYEDINPTHKKFIYGKRWNNNNSCEKIAKVIIPSLLLSECLIMFLYTSLLVFGFFSFSLILGIYLTDVHTLYNKYFSFFEVLLDGKSRKYSSGYIGS